MATSRKAAALPARATRPEHWDIAGFGGFIVAAFGVLSFVGLIVDDALLATGAAGTIAAGLGRAAPLGALAGALIGGAVLVAGARRRAIIDVTHFHRGGRLRGCPGGDDRPRCRGREPG